MYTGYMATHDHSGERFPMASHFPPDVNQRFWGALQVYPEGQVYERLEPDEQVVLLIRRHWVALLKPLLGGVALAVAPAAIWLAVVFVSAPEIVIWYGLVLSWFLVVFCVYYFFSLFVRYVGDVWVVTNERIIDLDVNTIALKSANEVDLSAVAGASQVRGGGFFFGGIDRGTVLVRIIGEDDTYIPDVPMSGSVAQVIGELAEIVQRERGLSGGLAYLGGGLE